MIYGNSLEILILNDPLKKKQIQLENSENFKYRSMSLVRKLNISTLNWFFSFPAFCLFVFFFFVVFFLKTTCTNTLQSRSYFILFLIKWLEEIPTNRQQWCLLPSERFWLDRLIQFLSFFFSLKFPSPFTRKRDSISQPLIKGFCWRIINTIAGCGVDASFKILLRSEKEKKETFSFLDK